MKSEFEIGWEHSHTRTFTRGEMGQLLYGRTIDIAHNLAHGRPGGVLRTNALREYTQRGEWKKAAEVARCLLSLNPWVRDEIILFFTEEGATKLLDTPIEALPSMVLVWREADIDQYHVAVLYWREGASLEVLIRKDGREDVLREFLETPVKVRDLSNPRFINVNGVTDFMDIIYRLVREIDKQEVDSSNRPLLNQ